MTKKGNILGNRGNANLSPRARTSLKNGERPPQHHEIEWYIENVGIPFGGPYPSPKGVGLRGKDDKKTGIAANGENRGFGGGLNGEKMEQSSSKETAKKDKVLKENSDINIGNVKEKKSEEKEPKGKPAANKNERFKLESNRSMREKLRWSSQKKKAMKATKKSTGRS